MPGWQGLQPPDPQFQTQLVKAKSFHPKINLAPFTVFLLDPPLFNFPEFYMQNILKKMRGRIFC